MPRTRQFPWSDPELHRRVEACVRDYWDRRGGQSRRQKAAGVTDTGTRGEVTGGQHLNAFCELVCEIVRSAGFDGEELRFKTRVELPGYYRPQKKWDVVVIRGNKLCAAMEMKSQVGPSFGNNFNNRSEEAIGSSADFWVAYREGVLGLQQPWLGYLLFVEEAPGSTSAVALKKASFPPMPVFNKTSYIQRYGILCQRLMLERNYNSAALIVSARAKPGLYSEPLPELQFGAFLKSLFGHLIGIS
jgi:restriction endonuclease XhoI-like protein